MINKNPPPAVLDAVSVAQGQRKRAVFTEQFKLDAVQRMQESECSPTALALELGIRRNQLYKWATALKQTGALPLVKAVSPAMPADLLKENARLRRELNASLEENAILKKLDAYLTRR